MQKKFLFQKIQVRITTSPSSILPIGRTVSGTTTPGRSRPGIDGNKGILHILHQIVLCLCRVCVERNSYL